MKQNTYVTPVATLVTLSSADVIQTSVIVLETLDFFELNQDMGMN